MEKVKTLAKTKWAWIAVAVVFIVTIFSTHTVGYSSGENSATVDIEEAALNYEELTAEIEKAEQELRDVETETETATEELTQIENEVEKDQAEFDELKELVSNQEQLEEDVSEAESTLTGLNEDISEAESELSNLTGELTKADSDPVELGAGHYVVGEDLPPSRYEITPTQGSGNVFIDAADGSNKVRETLGSNPDFHVPSYVFLAEEGDVMELNVQVAFTPVE